MKKLLYLADIRFPMERANGIQTIQTCHALARSGLEVELVVRRSDERSDEACLEFFGLSPQPGLTLTRVAGRGRAGFMAATAKRLLSRPDVVFTRDLLLADLLLALTGVPLIYEAHTVAAVFAEERSALYQDGARPSASKLERLDAREKRVCRKSGGIIAITRALAGELESRHGPVSPIEVVPDGCSVPATTPAFGKGDKVFYVGQLYPWKGVDVLVDSLEHADGVELVIIGGLPPEPDLDRLKARAVERRVDARIEFRGFIPPQELSGATERAAAFVVPNLESTTSKLYTSPLKLFEAMASGRPVVASDLPSLREILVPEENAILVPPGDSAALGAALARLMADGALRARLAARAFDDVKRYSWDARGEAIRSFIEDTAG